MWDLLKRKIEPLKVESFILKNISKKSQQQTRLGVIGPRHQVVYQALLDFAVTNQFKTLILCSADSHFSNWSEPFHHLYGVDDATPFISKLAINDDSTPFNLLTYSQLCNAINATTAQKKLARLFWEYELASVGAWDQAHDNIGDYDAIKQSAQILNDEAILQLSRYNDNLLRFIELEPELKLIESKWLSINFNAILNKIQNSGIQLIICDNSQEVTGIWAETLLHLLSQLGNIYILNLSTVRANLKELSPRNFQLQNTLFDNQPIDVKLPLLVQDKCAKPYLGLMAFTQTNETEKQFLEGASNHLNETLNKVENPAFVSLTLKNFVGKELQHMERDIPGHWAKRPEHLISILNFVVRRKLTLPAVWKIFFDKIGEISLQGELPIIRDYIFRVLINSENKKERQLGENLIKAFRPFGYEINENSIERSTSLIPNLLNRSAAKEDLLIKYLGDEFIAVERNLKAVVICDFFEISAATEIFPGNDFNGMSCGMVSILKKMATNSLTIQLNPIISFNGNLYFCNKFAKLLLNEVENYAKSKGFEEVNLTEHDDYSSISVIGLHNFSSFWNPFFKLLLSKKMTNCLIVGREFLTDKWENFYFNTLLNLSTATSGLFGSRLLARILFTDNDPVPAKHLWDFASFITGMELGMSDYERLSQRKQYGWHLREDGEFERGINYFHPELKTVMYDIPQDLIDEVNDTASRLVKTRQHTYEQWISKHDKENFVRDLIEIKMPKSLDPFKKFNTQRLRNQKPVNFTFSSKELVEALCLCICKTICDLTKSTTAPTLHLTPRRPGVFTLDLTHPNPEVQKLILETLFNFFKPIQNQHYVVIAKCTVDTEKNVLSKMFAKEEKNFLVPFGVPENLVSKEQLAAFLTNWQSFISQEKMMGHRLPEVREQVKAMINQADYPLQPSCRACQLLM